MQQDQARREGRPPRQAGSRCEAYLLTSALREAYLLTVAGREACLLTSAGVDAYLLTVTQRSAQKVDGRLSRRSRVR